MESRLEVQISTSSTGLSTGIEPLPYFPKLCRVLGGVTIAIVLTYLEIHHSAPEPDSDALPARAGRRNPPAMLDCDQACEDLGVSRRTLHTTLESLSCWWKSETQRSGAARSGRDFLSTSLSFPTSTRSQIKPYAIVGSRAFERFRILAIHRNYQRLDDILTHAGILPVNNFAAESDTCSLSSSVLSLSDVLEKALDISPRLSGIGAGWGEERRKAASGRMTARWLKYRETASK